MSAECVQLTTYFGERDRTPRRLLADALVDLYAEQNVRASVLLRGVEGFGAPHHLHTDRLLSLSEDLPVVSIALDSPARIEALLERVLEIKRRGLVTLERARLAGEQDYQLVASGAREEAAKLTVYLGRRERVGGMPAFVAVCELLRQHGLDGASALLGVDGLRHGRRARARFFSRNADVPVMVVAVGPSDRAAAAVRAVRQTLQEPLIALERARVCKRDGELLARPHELASVDGQGRPLWQKLVVYSSYGARYDGQPLHLEIVRRLRRSDSAGVTSLNAIWGFHGAHQPHGDKLLQVRRHVPVVTITIDTPARIARAFQIVDQLTSEHGLVTSEIVPALRAVGDGGRGAMWLADRPA
jgi:PII-like signaling protein